MDERHRPGTLPEGGQMSAWPGNSPIGTPFSGRRLRPNMQKLDHRAPSLHLESASQIAGYKGVTRLRRAPTASETGSPLAQFAAAVPPVGKSMSQSLIPWRPDTVTSQELEVSLIQATARNLPLLDFLVRERNMPEGTLAEAFSHALNLPRIDLATTTVEAPA